MFIILNALFKRSAAPRKHTEMKKCMQCLTRIDLTYVRCPHCGSGNFHFNNS